MPTNTGRALPEHQGQNQAATVLCVPDPLDSGRRLLSHQVTNRRSEIYLTPSFFRVVLQKSMPTQMRLIPYISDSEG